MRDGSTFTNNDAQNCAKRIILQASYQNQKFYHNESNIHQQSYILFLCIAKIVLASSDSVLSFFSIILTLLIPLRTLVLQRIDLMFPTLPTEFVSMISSTRNKKSLKSNLPLPNFHNNKMDNHAYCKLLSLLEYIAFSKKRMRRADVKRRHEKKMNGKVFQEFVNRLTTNVANTSNETNIAVHLVLWSDGFEPINQ